MAEYMGGRKSFKYKSHYDAKKWGENLAGDNRSRSVDADIKD